MITDLDIDGLDVARLVYVASVPGVAQSDRLQPAPTADPDLTHIVFGDDGTMVLDNDWFVTSDPAVATLPAEVIEHLRSHPRRPVALGAVLAPQERTAWRDVGTTVILGGHDESVPEARMVMGQ